jgi:spermidine/putrescine transport system ATP-binding protein
LLLDEPLGALDAKLREEMQIELVDLQKEAGVTFVFVTHSQNEALALSHRIAVMNHGNLEQIDQPSRIYGFPKNKFVAGFIGKTNMLDAQVFESTSSHLKLILSGLGEMIVPGKEGVCVGDKGTIAIRPEQVEILPYSEEGEVKNYFRGKVHDYLYSGDVTSYIVTLVDGTRIEALLPNSTPGQAKSFEVGDSVLVAWKYEAGIFLNE